MLCMRHLQEIETSLCIVIFLKEQLENYERQGLSGVDHDLWTDKFSEKLYKKVRRNTLYQKVEKSFDFFSDQNRVLKTFLDKHPFQYLNVKEVSSLKDIYHKARQTRNWLAHTFFIDYKDEYETMTGIPIIEDTLKKILWDYEYLKNTLQLITKAMLDGLYEILQNDPQCINEDGDIRLRKDHG